MTGGSGSPNGSASGSGSDGSSSGRSRPKSESESGTQSDPTTESDLPSESTDPEVVGNSESAGRTAPLCPSPTHSPEGVVRAQIRALTGDPESPDTGDGTANRTETDPALRTLFDFASPQFRTRYGSFEEFATGLSTPIHRRLLEAASIERGPLERDGSRAVQTVLAIHPDGDRTYEFVLAEQDAGKYEGCWMTDSIDFVYDGASPSFRRMPTVRFGDTERKCDEGDVLRSVLLRIGGHSPHNDVAQVANCSGNGLCGTCAVEVAGETSEQGARERARLELPPHDSSDGLRLACQTRVQGDVVVRKHDGLWGQHVRDRVDSDGDSPDPISVTDAEYDGRYDYAPTATEGRR